MYSFAQRPDTQVYDEPLYGHYLRTTEARHYHPGAEEIMASLEHDGRKVIEMMMGEHAKPVVFFKNMTHHLLDLDRDFMKDTVNIILTRDPSEMLPSFAKVIEMPTMEDVGYALHIELLEYFRKHDIEHIILDAKKVLLDPGKLLKSVCEVIDIPFDKSMLAWKAGPRPEDGVWAKYWYGSLHKSTGFLKYKVKTEPFPDRLRPLLALCEPCYQELLELSLG